MIFSNEPMKRPAPRAVTPGIMFRWVRESFRLFTANISGFALLSAVVIVLLWVGLPKLNYILFPLLCSSGVLLAMGADHSWRFVAVVRKLRTETWASLAILGGVLIAVVVLSETLIHKDLGVFDSGSSSGHWGIMKWLSVAVWCTLVVWASTFLWFVIPLLVIEQLSLIESIKQAFIGHFRNHFVSLIYLVGWIALMTWTLFPIAAILLFGPTVAMMYVSYRDVWRSTNSVPKCHSNRRS